MYIFFKMCIHLDVLNYDEEDLFFMHVFNVDP
jgi:hypothetical protein